jgi:DNA-directed RNA polymerase specialized sigma24 family protein
MAPDPSFTDLIRGIRAGDQQAAHQFVHQYEQVLRRQVRIHLTDPKLCRLFDSEDVCQMVFASFFVRAGAGQYDLERPEQLLKLLATMARNKVASLARKQRARPADRQRVEDSALPEKVLAAGPGPSTVFVLGELRQEIDRRLSDEEKQMVALRKQGRAWSDIAAALGGTPAARCMQFTRALDRVARELGIDNDGDA